MYQMIQFLGCLVSAASTLFVNEVNSLSYSVHLLNSLIHNTLSFLFFYTQSTTRRVYKKRQEIFYPFLTYIGANFCKECKGIVAFAQKNTQKSRVFTPATPKFIFDFLFRGFVYPISLQLKKPLRKLRDLDALKIVYSVLQ
jgi:hypothetical protein